MEYWDIFNKNGQPTGRTVQRGDLKLRSGEYHMVVHIWIKGPDGRLLLQRRSDFKEPMAGEWAATGGSVIAGESSVAAAKRELFEELSIDLAESSFKYIGRIFRRHSFVDLWRVDCAVDIDRLALQSSEVAQIKWASVGELREMIERHEFHDYGGAYFDTVLSALE